MGRRWKVLQAQKEDLQGQESVRPAINSDKKWHLTRIGNGSRVLSILAVRIANPVN